MLSALNTLPIASDSIVELTGLKDNTGAWMNAATVTFQVLDSSGAVVVASTSMSYVAASNGNYTGNLTVTATTALAAGKVYTISITAAQGGFSKMFRKDFLAAYASD